MNIDLLVLYTHHLKDCHTFYTRLGLNLQQEQHDHGPIHYAATLNNGTVIVLYPATPGTPTGRLRLGLTLTTSPDTYPPGRRTLADPDGRTIALTVTDTGESA